MLDHGVLNVPLSKRGNIDNQIDQYKRLQAAAQKAERKAAAALHRKNKAEAQRILSAIEFRPGLLDSKAAERGMTRNALLEVLRCIASSRPKAMVAFERDWLNA